MFPPDVSVPMAGSGEERKAAYKKLTLYFGPGQPWAPVVLELDEEVELDDEALEL